MFSWIGKTTTGHPGRVLVIWLMITLLSTSALLSGYGQGGLFDRMQSTPVAVPGSESQRMTSILEESTREGRVRILFVTEIDPVTFESDILDFSSEYSSILKTEGISEIVDPFAIRAMLQESQTELEAQATILQQQRNELETLTEASSQDGTLEDLPNLNTTGVVPVQEEIASGLQFLADGEAQLAEAQMELDMIAAEAEMLINEGSDSFAVVLKEQLATESAGVRESKVDEAISQYMEQLILRFPTAKVVEISEPALMSVILAQTQADLFVGEAVALPLAALIMVIVFGGFIAAGIPLMGALMSITIGLGIVWMATFSTTIDSFVLNVVSLIGLALSIDYGLLIVNRFREEAALRLSVPSSALCRSDKAIVIEAVRETVSTAGRTVFFSGITIASALSGLFLIRMEMLQIIGMGGVIISMLAVVAALTLIPALLTLLGPRLLAPSIPSRLPGVRQIVGGRDEVSSDHGIFSRLAHRVQAHPWFVIFGTTILLLIMASPLQDLSLRASVAEFIPAGSSERIAVDEIDAHFPSLSESQVTAIIQAQEPSLGLLVEQVLAMPNVRGVRTEPIIIETEPNAQGRDAIAAEFTKILVRVESDDPTGPEVTKIVTEMRGLNATGQMWVGGPAAIQYDLTRVIARDAPLAVLVMAAAVLILLFVMTGSLLVPIKALIINSLSVMAALGATSAAFQHGWLGITPTAGLSAFIVTAMVAFGFGLSMDYEVFLLGRIKEYWDAGLDNDESVARGLQRSGRIITSAAAIMVAVFLGFTAGEMIPIKQLGVGLTIMVVLDASVTRMLLVPATMTVMGKWNWWAPRPLRRLYEAVHEE